jgi:S1-C subfamily serine protease
MNKLKAFLIGAVSLLGVSVAQASTLDEIASSTYKLYIGGVAGCSSVAVSETKLVTAAHCIEGKDQFIAVEKLGPNFEHLSTEIVYVDVIRVIKAKDVALLEIRDGKLPTFVDVASPDEVDLKFGDHLTAVGYPKVQELMVTEGQFSAVVPGPFAEWADEKFYKISVPITGGNSGGGLYKSHWDLKSGRIEYELVGLTSAGYRDVSFMNLASTVESLDAVLKNLLNTTPKHESAGTDAGGLVNPADQK